MLNSSLKSTDTNQKSLPLIYLEGFSNVNIAGNTFNVWQVSSLPTIMLVASEATLIEES